MVWDCGDGFGNLDGWGGVGGGSKNGNGLEGWIRK